MSENKELETGSESELQNIIEAAIFAASEPVGVRKIQALFIDDARPEKDEIEAVIVELMEQYANKGMELVRIGSGWRFQTREKYAPWIRKLNADKPPRYSRAQLETLAIIAYRQPVTRGDIEEVRGVAVSSDIVRVLEERGWIREIGHRDVPGRPALFGTTQEFLAYFNLRSLRELPELIEERQFEEIAREMHMNLPAEEGEQSAENEGDTESAEIIPLHQPEADAAVKEPESEIESEPGLAVSDEATLEKRPEPESDDQHRD